MCFRCPACETGTLIELFEYGAEYKRFKYPPLRYYRCDNKDCNYNIEEPWQKSYNEASAKDFKASVDAHLLRIQRSGKVLVLG